MRDGATRRKRSASISVLEAGAARLSNVRSIENGCSDAQAARIEHLARGVHDADGGVIGHAVASQERVEVVLRGTSPDTSVVSGVRVMSRSSDDSTAGGASRSSAGSALQPVIAAIARAATRPARHVRVMRPVIYLLFDRDGQVD